MRIAVFADVHGRILLAFKLVGRYQRETGQHIDLILQCGDMGIFPSRERLDKATVRHSQADSTELGFLEYFVTPNAEAEAVLAQSDCPMICVRGNHEDHPHLDRMEKAANSVLFPVDYFNRIHLLKTGVRHEIAFDDASLRLLGVGRVGPPVGEPDAAKPKYIQEYERTQILSIGDTKFDVLLTHDTRRELAKTGGGMLEIELILEQYKPRYHFFGHTGKAFDRRLDPNGFSENIKLSDFEWQVSRGQRLSNDCFGVLNWESEDEHRFDVVQEPWLREYTMHTWRYVG